MKVRIVPYKPAFCDNSTWWKVQVKPMILWRTVGDYTYYDSALAVAKIISEMKLEFGETK